MAICENCGKEYLTKECVHCRNKKEKIKNKNNNENNTVVKIGVIIIATCTVLFTTFYFYEKYQENKIASQYLKMMYGTDDIEEIEKYNNQIIKKYNQQNKALIKEMDKSLNQINSGFEQALKKINNNPPVIKYNEKR